MRRSRRRCSARQSPSSSTLCGAVMRPVPCDRAGARPACGRDPGCRVRADRRRLEPGQREPLRRALAPDRDPLRRRRSEGNPSSALSRRGTLSRRLLGLPLGGQTKCCQPGNAPAHHSTITSPHLARPGTTRYISPGYPKAINSIDHDHFHRSVKIPQNI